MKEVLKKAFRNFDLLTVVMFAFFSRAMSYAQPSFRPFGQSQSIRVPPSPASFSGVIDGTRLINPVLFQPTSFGGIDCQRFNFFQTNMYWNSGGINTGAGLTGCQSIAANYNMPQGNSPLTPQLGERAPLSDSEIKSYTSSPSVARAAVDPYGELIRSMNRILSGPTGNSCPAGYQDSDGDPSIDLSRALSAEERERLVGDLGDQPPWVPAGRGVGRLVELLEPETEEDEATAGYYRYNDGDEHVYATERVEWNIRFAGRRLAEQGIIMGVGDISGQNGATPGHTEHQGGRDVDLRLIGPTREDGTAIAEQCDVGRPECYDRENTFKMVQAFIDADPYGIDKIFINDSELQTMINNYYREAYGITSFNGAQMARDCVGHHNHIHLSFKNNGTNPDDMARRANN